MIFIALFNLHIWTSISDIIASCTFVCIRCSLNGFSIRHEFVLQQILFTLDRRVSDDIHVFLLYLWNFLNNEINGIWPRFWSSTKRNGPPSSFCIRETIHIAIMPWKIITIKQSSTPDLWKRTSILGTSTDLYLLASVSCPRPYFLRAHVFDLSKLFCIHLEYDFSNYAGWY